MERKFSVAIVGAGMGGLSLAIALQKYAPDVDFQIYEGASQLSEIGAGISMHARAWKLMDDLGLRGELLEIAGDGNHPKVHTRFRKSDQAEGVEMLRDPSEESFTFHRGELQTLFLNHLQPSRAVLCGKRLVSYTQPNHGQRPIQLHFQDGTTATCDVLVGADGLRSGVRASMYTQFAEAASKKGNFAEAEELRSYITPIFSGAVICRTVIRKDTLPVEVASRPAFNSAGLMLYCGKNRHIVTYPVSQGRVLNTSVVLQVPDLDGKVYPGPWVTAVGRDRFIDRFTGWEPEVKDIVENIESAMEWAINIVKKLPTYVHQRAVLLGDAAHGMSPHQGAGAGQCFEDAYLLARVLGRPCVTRRTVKEALQLYDDTMRPWSQKVADLSQTSGLVHSLISPDLPYLMDLTEDQSASGEALTLEQLHEIGSYGHQVRVWRKECTTEEECEEALQRLDQLVQHIGLQSKL